MDSHSNVINPLEEGSPAGDGPNVVLTGFMGTGKSTVGRLLAEAIGYEFVDSDAIIEVRAGRSIAAIFAEEGEAAFRRLEADVAAELSTWRGLVIATGGRLMLDPANAAALEQSGVIFCLVATPESILARVGGEVATRPLLAGPDPAARVAALLAERAEGYGRFTQIATDGRTPQQVVAEIVRRLPSWRDQDGDETD